MDECIGYCFPTRFTGTLGFLQISPKGFHYTWEHSTSNILIE